MVTVKEVLSIPALRRLSVIGGDKLADNHCPVWQ